MIDRKLLKEMIEAVDALNEIQQLQQERGVSQIRARMQHAALTEIATAAEQALATLKTVEL